MPTQIVNIKKDKKYDVYCGRGKGKCWNPLNCLVGEDGWLGNPIVLGQTCFICNDVHKQNGETLKCYEIYLRKRLNDNFYFSKKFYELKGKKLGCYCHPEPCHVDIMIKILDS